MKSILFIHTSKSEEPLIKFIPLGLIPLANLLKDKNSVEIVNIVLEKKLDKNFDILDYIKEKGFDIVCLDLQWHYQTAKVIDTAQEIKEKFPKIKIIIGGYTASFFYKDIIKFPFIDFVIRGEAEVPLQKLVDDIEGDLSKVPNLVWKKEDNIVKKQLAEANDMFFENRKSEDFLVVENELSYFADEEILNKLNFTDLSALKNKEQYMQLGLEKNKADNEWYFIYNAGRGCNVNCSFCSGSKDCAKIITGRNKVIFTDEKKVMQELKKLSESGLGVWYTTFDPSGLEDYISLFKKIREENLKLRCKFECWKLPTKEFIDEFALTFENGSEIILSLESGSEAVRKKNKGFFFINDDFMKTIEYLNGKNINAVVYFTAGLAFETIDDFVETLKLVNELRKYKNVFIFATPIEIEPGSPMFLQPEKYRIKLKRRNFEDFYNSHKKNSSLGYETEFFSESEIPELVELIIAAARCRMSMPVFLKILENPILREKMNISKLWESCSICKFYKECWST